MASKEVQIKMTVDSTQVDQASKKVETTKKLFENSPITIKYDIDGKPLDVLIDKEVNLKQQTKLLYSELQKLSLAGKENSAEFRLLSARYNDTKDQLDKVNAKSRDLFASLALIPGPIGDIAGKLNGAIGLLKTFTGFSLKDIGNQFKELNNDLNDIVKNLFGVGSSANKAKAEVADTVSTAANTGVEAANTKATTDNAKAQLVSAESKGLDIIATKKDTIATLENTLAVNAEATAKAERMLVISKEYIAMQNAAVARGEEIDMTLLNAAATAQDNNVTKLNTLEKERNAIETSLLAEKETLLALTTETTIGATNGLNAALKALASSTLFWAAVIAGAVYGLYKLITAKRELTKEEKIAAEVNEKAIKDNGELISKLEILTDRVKKGGLSQREKNKAVNDYNTSLGDTLGKVKTYSELESKLIQSGPDYIAYMRLKAEADAAYGLAVEQNKKLIEERLKVPTASAFDVWAEGGVLGFFYEGKAGTAANMKARTLKELETGKNAFMNVYDDVNKKATALAEKLKLPVPEIKTDDKKVEPKALQDKELIEKEKQLAAELLALKEKDKKEREIKDLEAAKDKEKREILALNISKKNEGIRTKALTELEDKFQKQKQEIIDKYAEEEKKKQEEKDKALADAHQKLVDIGIGGIKDAEQKARVERTNKFNQDVKELDKLFKDKLISQEEYNIAFKNLQKGLDNDLEKMATEKQLKELEAKKAIDESRLKLLQEGTQAYYDQQRQVEQDNYDMQKLKAKDNATELERIEKEHADTMIAIGKAETEGKKALLFEHLDAVANIGASLQKIAGKNKDVAKAGIRIEQAVTTAKIIMNDLSAIRKAYDASPLTFGLPWSAVYAVDMGLGVIAANTSANNAISALDSAGSAGGGGGDTINRGKNYGDGGMISGPSHDSPGGGVQIMAEGGEAVMTRGAVTLFRPLLSMLNQAGGGTAFSGGAMGQAPYDAPESNKTITEAPIVKTYVVENELTTMQARQARLKSLSTL